MVGRQVANLPTGKARDELSGFLNLGQLAKDAYKGMSPAYLGSYGIDPDHLSRSHKVNKLALSGFLDSPEKLGPEIYGAKLKAKDLISSQSDAARLAQQVSPFIPPLSALGAVAAPFYQAGTELPRSAWRPDINVVDALQALVPQTIGNWSGLANKDLDTTRIIDDQIMKNVLDINPRPALTQDVNQVIPESTTQSQVPGWWRATNRRVANILKDPLGTISRLPLGESVSNVAENVAQPFEEVQYELPTTWEEQGRGAAFPVVGGLTQQENNKLLDPYIRNNLLGHKALTIGDKALGGISSFANRFIPSLPDYNSNMPGYDRDVRELTGWNTNEMNAAVHAAGVTDHDRVIGGNQIYPGVDISPSIRGLTDFYTKVIDKPKNNILAKWVRDPVLGTELPMGYTQSGRTEGIGGEHPDNIYDMWADEYSKELYDTGITTIQGMIDAGIARPETPHFNWGRNLPNEAPMVGAESMTIPSPSRSLTDYRLPEGPESLYSNDYFNQSVYNQDDSPANFLTPVRSLFDDPSISNENTLMRNSLMPISTGSGMGGMIEEGVQTDFKPRDVMPWGSGEQYMRAQGFEPVTPDYANLPVKNQTVFDSATAGPIGDYLRAQEQEFMLPSGPEDMSTDWRSQLGINPDPGYNMEQVLGMLPGGSSFNKDPGGQRLSMARFIKPEPSIENLNTLLLNTLVPQEGITEVVSRPTSQPGPGGPAKPQPEQDDSSNARQAREAEEKARADREKEKEKTETKPPKSTKSTKPKDDKKKKKKKKKLDPVVSAIQEEIFQQRNTDLLDFLTQGYSRDKKAVLPPSHMLYDI